MRNVALALTATLTVLVANPALAQRSASTKILGTAYDMWSSGAYFDHAYDHAAVLQNYAAAAPESVPQDVAKSHAASVRSNLTAAKEAYDRLAKDHKDDPTASKHIEAVGKHHAKAMAMCDKLDECCAKGHADPTAAHAACAGVADSIKAAKAEHEKLMQHLKVQKLNPNAKPAKKG
jgi:hypothetical protein